MAAVADGVDGSSARPLLSMRGIDKAFGGVPALREASLEIAAGEVHALIGQNGAGKSTLIKILTGYHHKDAGAVTFEGRTVTFATPAAAQRAGIATIHQEINLVPQRSVTENVCLGRESRRFGLLDWRAMRREAEGLIERLGLRIDVGRPLASFPTAVQQMVAIARAIGFRARLVVMDEPTSSLSDEEVAALFRVIGQLRAEGVAILFVSHKLDELYAICDRVTVMRDGRTVRTAAMADISRLDLVRTMLGRALEAVLLDPAHGGPAPRAADPVLSVAGLAAGPRVRDVSLDVRPGEIVGLAGLLGSGRTETARVVFGADPAHGGAVRINGRAGAPATPIDAIRAGVGFVSEDRKADGIVPDLSVRENMTLALMPRLARRGILDERRQRAIVDVFVERLGIRCAGPDQPIRELSGGNQQKVLLARWLCTDPRLLILDEPTRGIDVGAKAEILRLVRELAASGLGVLMISSELEEIVEAAGRVFVLREGRTVAELEGAAVREATIMSAMAHG